MSSYDISAIRNAFAVCNLDIEEAALPHFQCLCADFSLTLEELTAEWDTFSMNHQFPDATNADMLTMFRSHMAQRKGAQELKKRKQQNRSSLTPIFKRELYISPHSLTPNGKRKSDTLSASNGSDLFSPNSIASPPGNTYANRRNAGTIVNEFNAHLKPKLTQERSKPIKTAHIAFDCSHHMAVDTTYMFTSLYQRALALDKQLEEYEELVKEKYALQELWAVGNPSSAIVTVVGRIVCEASEGRLNANVVELEGSRRSCGGQRVLLDLSGLSSFQLFPGKIVALEGVYADVRGSMVVKRFLDSIAAPIATSRKEDLQPFVSKSEFHPLKIVLACGPFTTADNVAFQPLDDLIQVIIAEKPHVVILIGPFVDASHPSFKDGQALYDGMLLSFQDIFIFKVLTSLDKALAAHSELQFILVPSLRDAHHHFVYPQPPFHPQSKKDAIDNAHANRVHFMANPCTFTINNIVFGISSLDVILELSSNELFRTPSTQSSNRLLRLSEQVITQKSFCPCFPLSSQTEAPLDLRFQKCFQLRQTPDILILPSILNRFTGRVRDSIILNPGQMCKGQSGGTFAVLNIDAVDKQVLDTLKVEFESTAPASHDATQEAAYAHGIPDRTWIQIKRI